MPLEILLALVSFAFVTTMTPGPNNIMLTASGANFGFARSVPHMAGIVGGFFVLLIACGAGIGAVLAAFPALGMLLKILGAAYMLWLAWKVANAGAAGGGKEGDPRPLTFLQAAAFQWVNPKGVITALGAVALYVRPGHALSDFLLLLTVFTLACLLSVITWSSFGMALGRLLRDRTRAQIFNVAMALLLVASIVPMVL